MYPISSVEVHDDLRHASTHTFMLSKRDCVSCIDNSQKYYILFMVLGIVMSVLHYNGFEDSRTIYRVKGFLFFLKELNVLLGCVFSASNHN